MTDKFLNKLKNLIKKSDFDKDQALQRHNKLFYEGKLAALYEVERVFLDLLKYKELEEDVK